MLNITIFAWESDFYSGKKSAFFVDWAEESLRGAQTFSLFDTRARWHRGKSEQRDLMDLSWKCACISPLKWAEIGCLLIKQHVRKWSRFLTSFLLFFQKFDHDKYKYIKIPELQNNNNMRKTKSALSLAGLRIDETGGIYLNPLLDSNTAYFKWEPWMKTSTVFNSNWCLF